MRTTVTIPDILMQEALDLTSFTSKSDLVILAIQNLVRQKKREALKDLAGKVKIEIDLDRTRGRA